MCVYLQSECLVLVRDVHNVGKYFIDIVLHRYVSLLLEIMEMINHQIKVIHFHGALECINALGKRKVRRKEEENKSR